MKSNLVLILFILLCWYNGFAQLHLAKTIEIKKENSKYIINQTMISNSIYELHNFGDDNVWLWFENTNWMASTDSLIIKNYFQTIKKGNDVSLYHIGMDGNVGAFTPVIFISFLKCLLPNQYFYIEIISHDSISTSKDQVIDEYIEQHMVYYPTSTIFKYIPSIYQMNEIVFFKGECITLFETDLMKYNSPKN
jgi:hypothetical protein